MGCIAQPQVTNTHALGRLTPRALILITLMRVTRRCMRPERHAAMRLSGARDRNVVGGTHRCRVVNDTGVEVLHVQAKALHLALGLGPRLIRTPLGLTSPALYTLLWTFYSKVSLRSVDLLAKLTQCY